MSYGLELRGQAWESGDLYNMVVRLAPSRRILNSAQAKHLADHGCTVPQDCMEDSKAKIMSDQAVVHGNLHGRSART
jgi:hypothetical protein